LIWKEQLEVALRGLRDVQAARVIAEGETIREIHILSRPGGRGPKQIVRDVQTVVVARFGRTIDHRVISIAQPGEPSPEQGFDAPAPATQATAAVPVASPSSIASLRIPPEALSRIRFGSVNLYVSGPRTQAQVELRWKGISRMGSSAGAATRDGASALVAGATVAAIQEFLEEGWGLGVSGVEFLRLGQHEVAVVALTLIAHRQEKSLVGSCAIEQDSHQAVVLATLAALNRVVGGLPTREPTEYVLRPASNREDSEAS
jgi:hypothetical protein